MIIATRNRAESLRETLEAIASQETAGQFTYEVLVVDNGSTDRTRQVVEALRSTFPTTLQYLYEARPGKPWALNLGLRYAHGQLLAFTDDDVLPTPTWLGALWRCAREEHAEAMTGRVLPRWLAPRPAWLTDEAATRLKGLGCVDHGARRLSSRDKQNCWWVGGNMAVRREVIQQVGVYDTRMIRFQDTDYYYRCIHHGLTVVYEPAALAYHQVGAERMTPDHFRGHRRSCGYYHAYFQPRRIEQLVTLMPLWWYRRTLRFAGGWVVTLLTRRPWVERFYYQLKVCESLSFCLHRLQLWPQWALTVLAGGVTRSRRRSPTRWGLGTQDAT